MQLDEYAREVGFDSGNGDTVIIGDRLIGETVESIVGDNLLPGCEAIFSTHEVG